MRSRYTFRTGVLEAVMIVVALLFAVPFYLLVNVAFRQEGTTSSALEPSVPPSFDGVVTAWVDGGLAKALVTSILVTVVSSVIVIAVSAMASYYLVRGTGWFSSAWSVVFLGGLMLPLQLAALPLYTMIRDLGLIGSPWGLVVVYSSIYLPFSIFLYTLFLRALPGEFEESAQIEGCGPFQTFRYVVFPLLRPITLTIAILNGIAMYNDFFTPLLYLAGSGEQTVTVAITSFVGEYVTEWQVVFSGLLLASIPVLIAFALLQKQVIGGFAGGLKG
ncbi:MULTISPECIES: carbohydrate ABC transporter permease [unclassified Actinotalea]|uniref:carbohydrate ABC transporter permease n=1 Tax=unclassified Actinotalea TaxID=2638618 RepID=UPI0015F52AAA|nr:MULTISPECIES: carbohydrate ABC transporter permease [unclassified Actinotalea]